MKEWTSVEDRLPKRDILYGTSNRVAVLDGGYIGVGRYCWRTKSWLTHENLVGITHWQPLPDPPEVPND